jgi:hypothetical protein
MAFSTLLVAVTVVCGRVSAQSQQSCASGYFCGGHDGTTNAVIGQTYLLKDVEAAGSGVAVVVVDSNNDPIA